MISITHEIDGQVLKGPVNWQDIRLKVERKGNGVEINFSSLEFTEEDATTIKTKWQNEGYFKAIPYKITLGEGNDSFIYDAYIDGTTQATFSGCSKVICQIKQKQGRDWLSAVADGFSFAYLYDIGVITNADFVNVPYIVNYLPDGPVLLSLAISVFCISKEGYELIKEIATQVAELINAATPSVGVGVVVDVGDIIWAALNIVGRIVYAVLIAIAITKMLKQIFEQLFPLKRFHKGMTLLKMFQAICDHLGMTFQSTLMTGYAKDFTYVPTKDKKGFLAITANFPGTTGLGGAGYPCIDEPIYSAGQFIRLMKEIFNADFKIKNGVFIFERHDFFENNNSYIIPDIYNNQDRFQDDYQVNSDEMKSNTNIVWAYDRNDQNTLDDQTGRVWQGIVSINPPPASPDEDLTHGLKQVKIPFALGKRKNELNTYEKVVKALATATDALTGLFGAGTNFAALVEARIGCMLLSSHQVTVPKIVILKGGVLDSNQLNKLAAKKLWDNFHSIDCFVPVNGKHGQYKKYPNLQNFPMCLEDFLSLVQNLNCETHDSKKAVIDRLELLVYKELADMDFRVKELYDPHLKLTEII